MAGLARKTMTGARLVVEFRSRAAPFQPRVPRAGDRRVPLSFPLPPPPTG